MYIIQTLALTKKSLIKIKVVAGELLSHLTQYGLINVHVGPFYCI